MRRKQRIISITLALLLLVTGVASAREIIQGDQCDIGEDETVTGTLFVLCRTLTVEGRIEGNIIGAATIATIGETGTVTGSIYLLAGQLDVYGNIGKDLHFAGVVLRVHETVRFSTQNGDLISLGLSTVIFPEATVPGNVTNLGYQLIIDGQIGNEVNFWGSALTIGGEIGGNVYASVGDSQSAGASQLETLLIPFTLDVELLNPGLIVIGEGHIGGELEYTGMEEGRIDGTIDGETVYTPISVGPVQLNLGEEEVTGRQLNLYLSQVIREFTTLGVIGLVGLLLAPRLLQMPIPNLQQRPVSSLSIGLLSFILSFPIVLIIVILSFLVIFTLSLLRLDGVAAAGGIVLGLVSIGGSSLFYFIAIFIARVIVSLALGRMVVRMVAGDNGSQRILLLRLGVGVLILAIIGSLPAIGWVFNAVALFIGLGALLAVLQTQIRTVRETVTPVPARKPHHPIPQLPRHPQEAQQLPPPIIDSRPLPRGMDNLPEGFELWDEDEV